MDEKIDTIITVIGIIGIACLLAIYIVGFFPILATIGLISGIVGTIWMRIGERYR